MICSTFSNLQDVKCSQAVPSQLGYSQYPELLELLEESILELLDEEVDEESILELSEKFSEEVLSENFSLELLDESFELELLDIFN
jgi:hypothetical protein